MNKQKININGYVSKGFKVINLTTIKTYEDQRFIIEPFNVHLNRPAHTYKCYHEFNTNSISNRIY